MHTIPASTFITSLTEIAGEINRRGAHGGKIACGDNWLSAFWFEGDADPERVELLKGELTGLARRIEKQGAHEVKVEYGNNHETRQRSLFARWNWGK